MATATPAGFIEEIDYDELDIRDPVGKGSFGVVYMAIWRDIHVAVKMIESESEKISFMTELRQLSRVSHPNIICLYGACRSPVCLVMEFAECGSLYTLLHGPGPQPHYNSGHGMSWCLQCATGVAYLHGMKPKPLIHRDLKPPNLLLTNHGVVLKICDFGTACDQHTHMTNNKGSAAWMAPEVFEGCQYSEKCDVFSWGIILWEVLTRKKPFDDLGGPAFRIMWAVHTGARPNLIKDCPKPIEELMTRCWSRKPNERPSMNEVVDAMTDLMNFFPGGHEKLVFPSHDLESSSDGSAYETSNTDSMIDGHPSTISDTVRRSITRNNFGVSGSPRTRQWVGQNSPSVNVHRPQDLAMEVARQRSRSHTPDPQKVPSEPSRQPFKKGHRRASSFGNTLEVPSDAIRDGALVESGKSGSRRRSSNDLIAEIEQQPVEPIRTSPLGSRSGSPAPSRPVPRRVSAGVNSPTTPSSYYAGPSPLVNHNKYPPSTSGLPPVFSQSTDPRQANMSFHDGVQGISRAYITLELHFQPLPPSTSSEESMRIYREHCLLAEDYLKVNTEILELQQRAQELRTLLEQDEKEKLEGDQLMLEYQQLVADNTSLQKWYDKMRRDLAKVREKGQNKVWS